MMSDRLYMGSIKRNVFAGGYLLMAVFNFYNSLRMLTAIIVFRLCFIKQRNANIFRFKLTTAVKAVYTDTKT